MIKTIEAAFILSVRIPNAHSKRINHQLLVGKNKNMHNQRVNMEHVLPQSRSLRH